MSQEKITFGKLLRQFRKQSRDPETQKPLTQERLTDLLAEETGLQGVTYATISNWERDRYQIQKDDRQTLVGLIDVLHRSGGLLSLHTANMWLMTGNYRPLNRTEIEQVNPTWLSQAETTWLEGLLPTADAQKTALPPATHGRLFGVEAVFNELLKVIIGRESPWIVCLTGLGGMGKTALADRLARFCIDQAYFDWVVWVSVDDLEPTSEALVGALGERLAPRMENEVSAETRFFQIHRTLQQNRCLVVLDGLEEQLPQAWLEQLQKLTQPSKFLLTLRYPPLLTEANLFVRSLNQLSEEAIIDLLRYQAQQIGLLDLARQPNGALADLGAIVGGHPQALRLLVKLAQWLGPEQLVDSWRRGREQAVHTLYMDIYAVAWDSLNADAQRLLNLLPLGGPDGIDPGHLAALGEYTDAPIERVPDLLQAGLVDLRGEWPARRYGMHRLTEQFLEAQRAATGPVSAQLGSHYQAAIVANVHYWEERTLPLTERTWSELDVMRPALLRALRLSSALPGGAVTSALRNDWFVLAGRLNNYVEQRGYGFLWRPVLEQLVARFQDEPGRQVYLLNQLGNLWRLERRLDKAVEAHKSAEATALAVRDEAAQAQAWLNLGTDYLRQRRLDEAWAYGRLAVAYYEPLGDVTQELGAVYNLLGLVHRGRNSADAAINQLRRAVDIWLHLNRQAEAGRCYNNLALAYQEDNRFQEALTCFRDAQAILGPTASVLDKTLVALSEGALHFQMGDIAAAGALFDGIDLDFLHRVGHRFYTALTLNNRANVAAARRQFTEGVALAEASIAVWRELGDKMRLADSLDTLATALLGLGRRVEARAALEEALLHLAGLSDAAAERLRQAILRRLQDLEGSADPAT